MRADLRACGALARHLSIDADLSIDTYTKRAHNTHDFLLVVERLLRCRHNLLETSGICIQAMGFEVLFQFTDVLFRE